MPGIFLGTLLVILGLLGIAFHKRIGYFQWKHRRYFMWPTGRFGRDFEKLAALAMSIIILLAGIALILLTVFGGFDT